MLAEAPPAPTIWDDKDDGATEVRCKPGTVAPLCAIPSADEATRWW
jgi:hypothetical protein